MRTVYDFIFWFVLIMLLTILLTVLGVWGAAWLVHVLPWPS